MNEYFIGWGGLAVLNAALANAGRRSPLKYFLTSLLLGPLVTIILATTEDDGGKMRMVDLWKGRGRS